MAVIQKLNRLLQTAFAKAKRRRATKPTYSSVKKRLDSKKKLSEKKKWRKGLWIGLLSFAVIHNSPYVSITKFIAQFSFDCP